MRYGHSAVLIDDTVYIWGGRNDTEGACNVLYAFDVSKFQLLALPRHSCAQGDLFPAPPRCSPAYFPVPWSLQGQDGTMRAGVSPAR